MNGRKKIGTLDSVRYIFERCGGVDEWIVEREYGGGRIQYVGARR